MKRSYLIGWIVVKAVFIAVVILVAEISSVNNPAMFTIFLVSAVLLCVAEWGFSVAISEQKLNLAYGETIGYLEAVHRSLGFLKDERVRITLYVPCFFKKDKLRQFVMYLPESDHGYFGSFKKGLSTSKGIVGWSFREKRPAAYSIDEKTDYEQHMRDRWAFTENDLRQMRERKSYCTVPLINKLEKVGGVIYLDSPKRNVFTAEKVLKLINLCVPVAKWI